MSTSAQYHRLILVDDDPLVHFLIKKYLLVAGISIETTSFHDGEEIFKHISKPNEGKSVILLDLSMPVYSGWHFLNKFKELDSKYKNSFNIYIMSSSIDPTDQKRVEEFEEVMGFLPKPITDEILKKILL
ncbi:response regulator [Algoriphagus sp. PAP.12]|uniref:response regulator n=1 Tax=Algoriphagus sp. PAP.12 TaxID=2996678 RepID=UPI00227C2C15|nr:response regulator [Algoriphagus sp. PAP.12]